MSGNNIGDAGAASIAAVLPRLESLELLSLSVNSIGKTGAYAIAAVLPGLPKLSQPELDAEKIGWWAMAAIRGASRRPRDDHV